MKLTKKLDELIQQGSYRTTSKDNDHYHEYRVDAEGNGVTTFTHGTEDHQHSIKGNKVSSSNGHSHTIQGEDISEID